MIKPGQATLEAQRWAPFVDVTAFEGFDFSAATFAMHVRQYRDAPGDPLISLTNAISSAQGVSVSVATVEVDGVDTLVSSVQIRINETTLEALLLNAAGAGKDIPLVYDLHITSTGLGKIRWMEGDFIIRAGATQNG
ncbi:hypothetical protein [Brevundimonas sp. Root1423]|uniref:hypothetical protein n=1 Tax=Brevundimonas sp. Root1423 TaxID=1736462 RepID=UPI0006FA681C|nr:hypothetical protein [Brevundimonas sp. Root1423]KQY96404.1 hypothetical protein ASD25_00500 [Brevundimonas sp. Root1423]